MEARTSPHGARGRSATQSCSGPSYSSPASRPQLQVRPRPRTLDPSSAPGRGPWLQASSSRPRPRPHSQPRLQLQRQPRSQPLLPGRHGPGKGEAWTKTFGDHCLRLRMCPIAFQNKRMEKPC